MKVELLQAISKGLVELKASVWDLETIEASMKSKSEAPLEITVDEGTIFEAVSSHKMIMAVKTRSSVTVGSHESGRTLNLASVDLNMRDCTCPCKDIEGEAMVISKRPLPEDVKKLLALEEFQQEDFRLQQFAVWTITDNPMRKEYIRIDEEGLETSLGAQGIKKIKELFKTAGISTRKYRALL